MPSQRQDINRAAAAWRSTQMAPEQEPALGPQGPQPQLDQEGLTDERAFVQDLPLGPPAKQLLLL